METFLSPDTPLFTSENEHQDRLKAAQPKWFRRLIPYAFLTFSFLCVMVRLQLLQGAVERSSIADESPLVYSTWTPVEKNEAGEWTKRQTPYHPSEKIVFRFERRATRAFLPPSLYVSNFSSFENLESKTPYPSLPTIRQIKHTDTNEAFASYAVRVVPPDAEPGKHYKLQGIVTAYSLHPSQPAGFESEEFEVVNCGSEQERERYRKEFRPPEGDYEAFYQVQKTSFSEMD